MALRVLDTRTRRKVSLGGEDVRMYVCGPTVYAAAHMGHARSYVSFDVIRRYLEFRGHRVRFVMNITDVEDIVAKTALKQGVDWRELTERYAREYLEDLRSLAVKDADAYPKVSDHIGEIVAVAKDLVDAGTAYVVDGSVYLDTRGEGFGTLSHGDLGEAIVGEPEAGERRHPLDFAIWKAAKPDYPSWDSPWGKGYPGWHVECYAMAAKHLGEVDVHGGGRDLVYPHHESEELIARAHAGRPMARVWMHNAWLTLQWKKMSKSLGNMLTIRDVLAEWPGEVVRLCLAKAHYRENLEYDRACFEQGREELAAIRAAVAHVKAAKTVEKETAVARLTARTRTAFVAAMDDDFDAGTAFQAVLQFAEGLREVGRVSNEGRDGAVRALWDFGAVYGVEFVTAMDVLIGTRPWFPEGLPPDIVDEMAEE